jgi:hypothetical protein
LGVLDERLDRPFQVFFARSVFCFIPEESQGGKE